MIVTRRQLLALGGGGFAALMAPVLLYGQDVEVIEMRGTSRGERVWFTPIGLAIKPGTRVRFVNRDAGNSHTATAYHPELFDRQRRIPTAATPFHSDFLLPGESFEVILTVPGIYDYYCLPHERAAMVGRIVVGTPAPALLAQAKDPGYLSEAVLAALPAVDNILTEGRVYAEDAR